jgi:hypothetical protein
MTDGPVGRAGCCVHGQHPPRLAERVLREGSVGRSEPHRRRGEDTPRHRIAAQRRVTTSSRYFEGITTVSSPERLKRPMRSVSSVVKAAAFSSDSAPYSLWIGP